jgi:hypothetical protein
VQWLLKGAMSSEVNQAPSQPQAPPQVQSSTKVEGMIPAPTHRATPQATASENDEPAKISPKTNGLAVEQNGKTEKNVTVSGIEKSATAAIPTTVPKHVRNTYKMVSELSEKAPDIACWSEDGTMFTINDKQLFVTKMPEYGFGMNKFDNFVKQQNNYGAFNYRIL